MQIKGWVFRTCIATIIIVNLVLRYNFGLETFELRWVEGWLFNWFWAPVSVRLLAFYEVFAALMLVFGKGSKKQVLLLLFPLSVCYLLEGILCYSNPLSGQYPMFYFFHNTGSLVMGIVMGIFFGLFFYAKSYGPLFNLKKRYIVSLWCVLCVGVFFMNHLSPNDFKSNNVTYVVGVSEWNIYFDFLEKTNNPFINNPHYIVAFLSTHCEVCVWNAMKISAAERYYNTKNKFLVVFFDPQESINTFLEITKLKAHYVVLSHQIVGNLVGDGFPVFIEIKNNEIIREFSPKQFNYTELHRIFSIQ